MSEELLIENNPENMELVLVTSSINHEYAKTEFEKTNSFQKREELLARMSNLKQLYFSVRQAMLTSKPERLAEIEEELRVQKQQVFPEYLA